MRAAVDSASVSPCLRGEIPPRIPPRRGRKTLVIFSQTFVPDPASVGQHVADVAVEMARRGYRVRVYTSSRGYENPSVRYLPRENLGGAEIRRLPLASFGKKNLPLRVLGTAAFQLQCLLIGLFLPRIDAIFFSTSPPLIGVVAGIIQVMRRVPIIYWAMDLNPDQLIALGKLKPSSWTARILESVNRLILRRSTLIIALDRFMSERLLRRGNFGSKLLLVPPWPHEEQMDLDRDQDPSNPFRARHQLDGKFVVMYSGNHSPSNPLTTLLEAAVRLKDEPDIRFLFVGGGHGKREVENYIQAHGLSNVLSLPYQPLSELKHSLPAADVHIVSLGEQMVGIVHPCKIYGAMAVARPVLYFGPTPSHIGDLLARQDFGRQVRHGDVEAAVAAIREFHSMNPQQRRAMGIAAHTMLEQTLSQQMLCAKLCDQVEEVMAIN
jgi:colanic acid biosynthesis glycosyl transferase WcaI